MDVTFLDPTAYGPFEEQFQYYNEVSPKSLGLSVQMDIGRALPSENV